MKKKIIALCLVVCLIAIAAIGGTLAYFTDTDQDVNVFVSGNVSIDQMEHTFDDDNNFVELDADTLDKALKLMPVIKLDDTDYAQYEQIMIGDYYSTLDVEEGGIPAAERYVNAWSYANVVDKYVSVYNDGNNDAYVRTIIAVPAAMEDLIVLNLVAGKTFDMETVDGAMIDGVEHSLVVLTYKRGDGILEPGKSTGPSLYQVLMFETVDQDDIPAEYADGFELLVFSQAVQADGFAEALEGQDNIPHKALNAAFGEITATNNPWA